MENGGGHRLPRRTLRMEWGQGGRGSRFWGGTSGEEWDLEW